jgi:hypothetical protein
MSYISGENRGQAALLPAAIEGYVEANVQLACPTILLRRF